MTVCGDHRGRIRALARLRRDQLVQRRFRYIGLRRIRLDQLRERAAKVGGAAEAADGYLALGDYAKAAELYRKALTETPADPGQVNTRLGIALARAGDAEGAKQVLSAITGPWRDVAQFWLVWAGQAGVVQPARG